MAINMKFREFPAKYISWQIPKFFDLPTEKGYILDSSPFSLFGAKEKWYLQILPNDTADAHVLFILLLLVKETSSVERRVAFKMGLTYPDAKDVISGSRNETFKMENDWYGIWLIKRSRLRSTSDAVASDGTLTVFCAAMIVDKLGEFPSMEAATRITVTTRTPFSQVPLPVTTLETASHATTSEGETTLIENLKDLYVSKRCADVKIIVKGIEFLAHSHILISRSKVFSSMLNIDLLEKKCGVVEITDCDPISFGDFLLFTYTGNLEVVSARNATSL